MSSNQCIATTATGLECTRRAVIDGYCTQHYNMLNKHKKEIQLQINNTSHTLTDLPNELSSFIVSDYIEFDQLKQLQANFTDLKINPDRIQTTTRELKHLINPSTMIETIIDGVIRIRIFFNMKGEKIKEINYNSNNQKNGPLFQWLDNKLISEENYIDGVQEGFQYKWNDGIQVSKLKYKYGLLNGTQYTWYLNGNKKSEYNYINGKREGFQYDWWENGKIKYKENYNDGLLRGAQYGWYDDGNKSFITNYLNGKKEGPQYGWWENGTVEYTNNYKDGLQDGLQYNSDKYENKKMYQIYSNGVLDFNTPFI
jgi:antitoxin component YwqK of YwqJK toxin-antitoxin module